MSAPAFASVAGGLTAAPRGSELGDLADPSCRCGPIEIRGTSKARLEGFLRDMVTIRVVEETIGRLVEEGVARTPCHLGIGQEAIAVGVSASLNSHDRVFGGHRSHAHYLALGGDLYALAAEVLGKAEGASGGMGGSMHLVGREVGFHGSVPIVGATIPIALGAALAARMDSRGAVGVAYFGDGAVEEGVFHESLNLAAILRLPALFVCENNLFSSHLDISLRQPSDRIARFAEAHRIACGTIDGNDVVRVADTARDLLQGIRAGEGPAFLETVTYRHRGHVGPKEDVDVGVRRKLADVYAWKQRDPLVRLSSAMIRAQYTSEAGYEGLIREARGRVESVFSRAMSAPYPPDSALLDNVYVRRGP